MVPAGLILGLSVFCGALAVAPAHRGPRHVVTIVALAWSVAELLRMAARHRWRPLGSWPKPRWNVTEAALIVVAVLVGGVVGPHLLAGHAGSDLESWGRGAAVAVVVAGCLFGAQGSYRRRASRPWPR